MNPRILITGPSGMGKTTLANWVAGSWQIPFVSVSLIKNVCKCYGLKTHEDVIRFSKNNPDKGLLLQLELISERANKFQQHQLSGYVTDRGHIDSIVYTEMQSLKYMGNNESHLINPIYQIAKTIAQQFTHVIFIPWIEGWEIEDDKVRVVDSEFQFNVSLKYETILREFNTEFITLNTTDFRKRQDLVEDYINAL